MVEGPARSAGGSSLAPTIARREAAGALLRVSTNRMSPRREPIALAREILETYLLRLLIAYSMTPVNRSPNSRANWGMAADHLGVARFQEAVKFMMAR